MLQILSRVMLAIFLLLANLATAAQALDGGYPSYHSSPLNALAPPPLLLARDASNNNQNVSRQTTANRPTIRLYDTETDMEVVLNKAASFWRYCNQHMEYCVDIPDIFTKVVRIPSNGDGIIISSADSLARFRVSGGFNIDAQDIKTHFAHAKASLPVAAAYSMQKDNFWVLSWLYQGKIHYRKFMLNGERWCELEIIYPESQKHAFDKPVTHASRSLASLHGE